MNTILKVLAIVVLGMSAASASANDIIKDHLAPQYGSAPSINPQPLPPRTVPP